MINKNKWGLAIGLLLAILHAVWSLAILIMPASLQKFIDWVFVLHAIKPIYVLTAFNLANAIILVILTFVIGYIIGYILAALINMLSKEAKSRR